MTSSSKSRFRVLTGLILAAVSTGASSSAMAQYYDAWELRSQRPAWERRYREPYVMRPDYGSNYGYRRYSRDRWEDEDDYDPRSRRSRQRWQSDDDDDGYRQQQRRARDYADDGDGPLSDEVRSGGPRPAVSARTPARVRFVSDYKEGSIVIDQATKQLYYVLSDREAFRYPISVGREGFSWTGTEKISRVAEWPDWHPPEEMRERDPKLPKKMTGGINNPLGAKAIYLGNTLYRIHGTNDPKSIGRAASSGCFRMMNEHVVHLAGQVEVGAEVHVLKQLPKEMASAER